MNGPGRGGRGGPNGPGLAELNLTPEQQASVARIRLDAADATATLAGQGHELRDELHRATFADTKDAAKLTDLTTRILAIEKQLIEIQTKAQTETATVLTAEQRKKMRVMGGNGRGQGQGRD
jgi:Spy/CpxP family protein refolding chaperone